MLVKSLESKVEKHVAVGVIASIVLALCQSCASAPDGPIESPAEGKGSSAVELNREGRWAEAAVIAEHEATDESLPVRRRCEAYYSLVYAEIRLGRRERAAAHLRAFDGLRDDSVSGTWVLREIDRLREGAHATATPAVDDWETVDDSARLGFDAEILAQHQELCRESGADACLIVQDGRIIQEWYAETYAEPIEAMSSTKSVSGLLVGMLEADGKLSRDDPVARWVPEWQAGAEGGVTIRHLLTMTSGLLGSHVKRPAGTTVGGVTDKDALVFSLPLVDEPGTAWAYSNEGAYLLSPILRRAAGEPLEDYAQRRLLAPLGMTSSRMHVYPEGQTWTHATLWTTPRDLARIGQLMLDRGQWRGEQIVPETWVAESTRSSQSLKPDYGLLWWLDVPDGYAARGAYDTNIYVFPARRLVVVRMQRGARASSTRYEPAAFGLLKRLYRGR
ncbi:MAG: serine hydrolase [Planctomycetes bacterium]|nr:serine hydrolase [Planctomycetota bacterium]